MRNFWLFLIVFVLISCLNLVFLRKAIMVCELLNIYLKLLLMLSMCHCLIIISFMFCSTGLYVTGKVIESLRLGLQCFKSHDQSRWSTLWICFLTVDSLLPFSIIFFIRSLECFLHTWKVEYMHLILSAWLYGKRFLSKRGCADFAYKQFWQSVGFL